MNSTLPETTDYHSSSGMSELDSLSDSDWLDIASGRGSDNDSLSDESEGEGDEPVSQPLSRTSSSISIGSSRGEVEAWEGFVDHSGGDDAARVAPGMYPMPQAAAPGAERIPLGLIPDIVTDLDIAEDELVKEALNQSLISTLNASRTSASSSGSNQASVRDLRLSFPDPLTSPRDELERSYQEVSVDEGDDEFGTDASTAASEAGGTADPDPGLVRRLSTDNHEVPTKADFEIHLYGASTQSKWAVVQDFLQKVADGSGQFLINTLDPTNEKKLVRTAILGTIDSDSKPFFNAVKIFDRTEDDLVPETEVPSSYDTPSLGIVFLPSNRLPVLSPHTAYIAVLASDNLSEVIYNNNKALRGAAEDDWDLLNIHPAQTLKLRTPSPVIEHGDIESLNARHVHRALESILYGESISQKGAGFKGQATPANAVKVITLVSVLLSIAFNASSFRSPTPTPTVNLVNPNDTWTSLTSLPNRSSSVSVQGTNGKPQIVTSAAGDTAVSIYNAGTTALSLTPQVKSLTPTVSPARDRKGKRPEVPAAKEAPPSMTPIVQPDVSATSPTPSVVPQAALPTEKSDSSHPEPTTTAVGLNFVSSLSEVLGVTTKSIVKAVGEDGNELLESLDDLMAVIRTQTDDLIKQSKGKARALGDQVQAFGDTLNSRNDRARTRAKELKRLGGELILSASEKVRDRTTVAKNRARRIRQSVEDSEAWQMYQRVHDDWALRLQETEDWMESRKRARSCFRNRERRRGGRARDEQRHMGSSIPGCA